MEILVTSFEVYKNPSYLSFGYSYKSLQYGLRVTHSIISRIIPDPCKVRMLSCPKTPEEWKEFATLFDDKWNFHHAVICLEGEHIAIRCTSQMDYQYYSYEGLHSVVVMARGYNLLVLYCDVIATWCSSDEETFSGRCWRISTHGMDDDVFPSSFIESRA